MASPTQFKVYQDDKLIAQFRSAYDASSFIAGSRSGRRMVLKWTGCILWSGPRGDHANALDVYALHMKCNAAQAAREARYASYSKRTPVTNPEL